MVLRRDLNQLVKHKYTILEKTTNTPHRSEVASFAIKDEFFDLEVLPDIKCNLDHEFEAADSYLRDCDNMTLQDSKDLLKEYSARIEVSGEPDELGVYRENKTNPLEVAEILEKNDFASYSKFVSLGAKRLSDEFMDSQTKPELSQALRYPLMAHRDSALPNDSREAANLILKDSSHNDVLLCAIAGRDSGVGPTDITSVRFLGNNFYFIESNGDIFDYKRSTKEIYDDVESEKNLEFYAEEVLNPSGRFAHPELSELLSQSNKVGKIEDLAAEIIDETLKKICTSQLMDYVSGIQEIAEVLANNSKGLNKDIKKLIPKRFKNFGTLVHVSRIARRNCLCLSSLGLSGDKGKKLHDSWVSKGLL